MEYSKSFDTETDINCKKRLWTTDIFEHTEHTDYANLLMFSEDYDLN